MLDRNLIETEIVGINSNPQEGRYLFAERDIKAGEIIIKEQPLNHGPRYSTRPACLGCYKFVQKSSPKCISCGWPLCSNDCPSIENHKPECGAFVKAGLKVKAANFDYEEMEPLYDIIAPLRILLQRESNPSSYNLFFTLESHLQKWRENSKFRNGHRAVFQYLTEQLKLDVDEETVQRIFGIFYTNDFSVRPKFLAEVQQQGALSCHAPKIRLCYVLVAMASHSCIPNTWRNISGPEDGFTHTIHARHLIKKGDQILISYQDLMLPNVIRREQLLDGKKFLCLCPRCADPTELGTHAGSLQCPLCSSPVINPVNDMLRSWRCQGANCSFSMPHEEAKELQMKIFEILETAMEDSPGVESYEDMLREYEELLHPNNMLLCLIRYNLCGMYGRLPGYEMSRLSVGKLKRKKLLCEQLLEVVKKLEPGISHVKGILYYELHMPTVMLAQLGLQSKALDSKAAETEFRRGLVFLKLSLEMLRHEPEGSFERRLFNESEMSVVPLEQHIEAMFGKKGKTL